MTKNQILARMAELLIPMHDDHSNEIFDTICDELQVDIKYYDQLTKPQLVKALAIVEKEASTI